MSISSPFQQKTKYSGTQIKTPANESKCSPSRTPPDVSVYFSGLVDGAAEEGEGREESRRSRYEWILRASLQRRPLGRENKCTCAPPRNAERPAVRPVSLCEVEHTCCVA